MNNCLVTKLKGAVDNDALSKIGECEFDVVAVTTPTIDTQYLNLVDSGNEVEVEVIGDGYILTGDNYASATSAGKTVTIKKTNVQNQFNDTAPYYWLSNGNYKIRVKSKYNINVVSTVGALVLNLNNLDYSPVRLFKKPASVAVPNVVGDIKCFKNFGNTVTNVILTNATSDASLSRYNVYGDVANLSNKTAMTNFTAANSYISGNISVFANMPNLSTLRINNTDVSGNAESLSSLTGMAVLSLENCPNISGDIAIAFGGMTSLTNLYFCGTDMEGDIVDLVNAWRVSKSSGDIATNSFGNGKLKFNGVIIPEKYSNSHLVWTATTITFRGETVTA